jgi:hypothetical protein
MTATSRLDPLPASEPDTPSPRFGGLLWRITRRTTAFGRPFAGKSWNPVFAVVEHRGRRTGDGFVVSLAFGAQVDWYRNLVAAYGGTIRWRGQDYAVGRPELIDRETALAAFHPVQRFFLRIGRIDGYVAIQVVGPAPR